MPEKKILVIAAAGNVGKHVVADLVRRGEKVKAATRNGVAKLPAGAEAVHLDLQDASTLAPALADVDRIFAVSPTGYLDQLGLLTPLIEAAATRKIKVVLQTAFGVDASEDIPFRKLELLLERSGAPFVILRPNWFSDNFASYWAAQIAKGEIRLPAGEGKSSFIDARDIAAAAVGALTTNAHDGKAFALTGPSAHSYAEAAELLSQALGRRISYAPIDGETFVAEATANGFPEDYARLLTFIFQPVAEGWTSAVTDAVETLSGHKPRSLATSIAELTGQLKAAA